MRCNDLAVRRRLLLALLGSSLAPSIAAAADEAPKRIAILVGSDEDKEADERIAAFRKRLTELGWRIGDNVLIEVRWAKGDPAAGARYASELLTWRPDVVVAHNTMAVAQALHQTRTVPIVFATLFDPAKSGFVTNFARPEGNVTGFTNNYFFIGAKWPEMLKEIAPQTRRIAVLFNPRTAPYTSAFISQTLQPAADRLDVTFTPAPVEEAAKIEVAVAQAAGEPAAGMLVMPDPFTKVKRHEIVEAAARHRLPTVYPWSYFVKIGGLLSYGVDLRDNYRHVAQYCDRILRGEKVANLPVQTATRYELVVNEKTARELGLTLSPTLRLSADEIIES